MSYRPKKTEYMFKIVRMNNIGMKKAPYRMSFAYRDDRGWHKPVKGALISCSNGFHSIRLKHLPVWLRAKQISYGHKVYLVKVDMDGSVSDSDKIVARSFRFVCELETSLKFIGSYMHGNGYYWEMTNQKPSPQYLVGLAKRWGLDIENGKIVGEYT